MKKPTFFDETRPTSIQSTVFTDGMVVNAGDLDTAMMYPLEVIQVLIRAYFGCGIVCGLDLKPAPCNKEKPDFHVKICRGVALDCDGFPLQLQSDVTIDLTPDPCVHNPPSCICIAISRTNSPTAPRKNGCDDSNDNATSSYARKAELVRIKAFDCKELENKCSDLTKNLCSDCKKPRDCGCGPEEQPNPDDCENCPMACPEPCCGESWVLIGCVTLTDCGIPENGIDTKCRKYVFPVAHRLKNTSAASGAIAADTQGVAAKAGGKKTAENKP